MLKKNNKPNEIITNRYRKKNWFILLWINISGCDITVTDFMQSVILKCVRYWSSSVPFLFSLQLFPLSSSSHTTTTADGFCGGIIEIVRCWTQSKWNNFFVSLDKHWFVDSCREKFRFRYWIYFLIFCFDMILADISHVTHLTFTDPPKQCEYQQNSGHFFGFGVGKRNR